MFDPKCEYFLKKNSLSDKFEVWQEELDGDEDKEFLLNGILHGFRISDVEDVNQVKDVYTANHPSVRLYHDQVKKELDHQIDCGNYILSSCKPSIVSPLAAIPKEDKDQVRIIHDASRPSNGTALNDYAIPASVKYEKLDDAFQLASPYSYMCKIDLKAAYRSVAIHPVEYNLTGLQFDFNGQEQYMFDVRLPFGSSKGPMIFHRLSQSVKRMMQRRGYKKIVVYLDDFLCVEGSYEECCDTQRALISLLIRLGFQISWPKVLGPSQRIEFLGIEIDTLNCTASLSDKKLIKLHEKLQDFSVRKRASKRQLQSLAGSLNWACQAIKGGRFFLRRILDTINRLKCATHKCKLTNEFKADLHWWMCFMNKFNGTVYYREVATITAHTDACNEGAGMFCHGDWRYVNWKKDCPKAQALHINYKEVLGMVLAVKHWAGVWANCDVTLITDSTVAKAIINKGRCKNSYVMGWLRHMFWIMVTHNIRVRAIHIPGCLNQIPDSISRLHEPGQVLRLHSLLKSWFHGKYLPNFDNVCRSCMSTRSFQVVFPHLNKWHYRLH